MYILVHWDEVGEAKLLGLKIVQQTTKVMVKTLKWMKITQSCQKSYANVRHENLEFTTRDNGF